ncbi:SCP2 sterol-binding domain-containing protein [Haloglycomyces albus]|uniref:SCP2 sterol-binding domain-containing protein n=1 Tax=Haloglycomyces albus TaxID=526067 RepID=UPI00046CD38D|nr:SCP2 sterol-binding domain-containing protein [Haloglycomyces albus]
MATAAECRDILEKMVGSASKKADKYEGLKDFKRNMVCDITDLGVQFRGTIDDGKFSDLSEGDDPDAEVRLTIASDDLVKVKAKELSPAKAFLTGKVKIKASVSDLNKMRKALKVD